jgi:hypothetical protein
MVHREEVIAILEAYHKQISKEKVDYSFLIDFLDEQLQEIDHRVEKSYEVDFTFEDL